jgi:hypothetical protein
LDNWRIIVFVPHVRERAPILECLLEGLLGEHIRAVRGVREGPCAGAQKSADDVYRPQELQ